MKTSFRILAACLAASLALVSCEKESTTKTDNGGEAKDGARTITVSFSPSTKSTLGNDGVTPGFTTGDLIKLADKGGATEEVSVTVTGNTATITTALTGELTAVYPASASTDGINYTVSSSQDGTFAKANICTATISDGANPSAVFETQVAILCFYVDDESIGVKKIEIDGTGVATGGNKITVTPLSPNTTLYNVGGGPDKRICYAAVNPVSSKEITFKGTARAQTQSRKTGTISLTGGYIYNAFIPYYIEVEGVKWGYCNVGAFLPEENGQYFMWGETTGHYPSATAETGEEFKTAFTANVLGFAWDNCLFTSGVYSDSNKKVFTKYVPKALAYIYGNGGTFSDGKSTLESSDDAATQNWGEGWRMPTKGEFDDLISKTSTSMSNFSNGILTINGHPSLIFPGAGLGNGAKLFHAGLRGCYWSSSLNTDNYSRAEHFAFYYDVGTSNNYRFSGDSVRPVSK